MYFMTILSYLKNIQASPSFSPVLSYISLWGSSMKLMSHSSDKWSEG